MYSDRRCPEFLNGMHSFLNVAEKNRQNGFIFCPCKKCQNKRNFPNSRTIHTHLLQEGFMPSYFCWTKHGERGVVMEDNEEEEDNDNYPMFGEHGDTEMGEDEPELEDIVDESDDDLRQVIREEQINCASENERLKLERMLEHHKKLLYPNCEDGQKKLGTTLELLQWKAENGISDKGFEKLLKIMKKMLPRDNVLPCSTYEAKKVVCPLGLEVHKIHACINDCILYRGQHENLNACPVCGAFRYKIRRDDPGDVKGDDRPRKRVPAKVMWHAPIIPRLKRLFRNKEHAKLLRWHKEDHKEDDMLRQPADGSQWRNIDDKYEDFARDARNLWFGLSTDGLNPFGEQSPSQPGNNIDVYLRPLVDELLELWADEGVRVWDEYKQDKFDLRGLLFVTINDWPALSNISGQSNKGYSACTHCLGETESIHIGKNVYPGHRRFLPDRHPVRKKGKHFKGEVDTRRKPTLPKGTDIYDMVKDIKVIFGKGPGAQSVPNDADNHVAMWKKKSIFWELPYWKFLEVRSAIDVMHVTKNICNFKGPASYALTKEEKEILFQVLSSIKVPSGYSSNIKGILNLEEKKFQNLKSHDCHVIMTQLLPIALRGLLPENVRVPIVKLCAFLNAISQKAIDPATLPSLQKDVFQCLVSFELVFPPTFFNMMTHIIVHLVQEISVLGPVFLHNMFPFERFTGVLKNYVKNRARPEGSMVKDYGTEEVIEFCVDFIPNLNPIGVPQSRHEGRLRGKGTLGKKSTTCMDEQSFTQAHYTVLVNSSLAAPYIQEHKNILRQPSSTLLTFKGYEINGNTFYTADQDKKSTNQNSGVRFDAKDDNGQRVTYYGYIEQIWELDYGPSFKVPLFWCKWFNLSGVKVDPKYGMTTVDQKNLGYGNDQFVLANDVAQVFYVKDMSSRPRKRKDKEANTSDDEPRRHIVLSGKRNIVGVKDKTDMSEDYNKFDEIPPFKVKDDPSIPLNDEDTPWLR
ncbi:uncharacterized protein LOC123412599, partial [Hordeum vulgare subsp. vulgare]|uniref:uncharacterized protein LOC123412599 n=1 Tax=Hordeum vulgare subsp. vulgare TaxID=112509 RepID=UPI001D1A4C3E